MAETSQAAEASTQATPDSRPVYEAGFHLLPSIPEGEVVAVVEQIRGFLDGAEIIAMGTPTKMTLAYTIERAAQGKREKFSQSHFGWVKFATEDRALAARVGEALREMKEVVRYLIIESSREEVAPRRAVFGSDRLEGQTIAKPTAAAEKGGEVSDAELDKSIDALTG